MRLEDFNLNKLTEGIYMILQKTSGDIKKEVYLGSRLEDKILDDMHCTHEDIVASILELRNVGLIIGREGKTKFRDFYTVVKPEDIDDIPEDEDILTPASIIRKTGRDMRDMKLADDAVKDVTGFNTLKDYLLDIKSKEGRFYFNKERTSEVAVICEISGLSNNRILELMLNITFSLNPVNAGNFD